MITREEIEATITADLTDIVSDESRRNGAIQLPVSTASNPEATFVLNDSVVLGGEAAQGESVDVTASVKLTINGQTNPVEIALRAQ